MGEKQTYLIGMKFPTIQLGILYLSLLIVKLKQQFFFFRPSLVLRLQLVKTAFCVLSKAIEPYFSQKLTLLSSVINS